MREILTLLPKPSRYLGIEEGARQVSKEEITQAKLHIVLAFPDMYEIGMSYLGQKILYGMVNSPARMKEGYIAERVFTPCSEAGALLKKHNVPLASMESDTNLDKFDVIGFSLTHELAFTNILYMLDLANIPLYAKERGESLTDFPLILVGGGCTLCAEPIAPFVDIMIVGEAEPVLMPLLELFVQAKKEEWTKLKFLEQARFLKGVYIPSFFEQEGNTLKALYPDYTQVQRALVTDLDCVDYPIAQISPFGAIHNRLTLEIARGCTRGCRFCQAGMTTRPSRERSVDNVKEILETCLQATGYEDVSFLSLSAGDFSALKTLFLDVSEKCAAEQISLSLPSLRVGSVDGDIMERIAGIRRTGATLAPEAGSQRLRDVINKGITEEALLEHVRQLVFYGWQQVKLYFMIGLPTETYEDLDAIIETARKVRDIAIYFDENGRKKGSQLQVTVSVSPFVPKTHTPFQWDAQISLEEMTARVRYLRNAAKQHKNIKLRWHEPAMSHLEGILSRADRKMSGVIYKAYQKGAIFTSWVDEFKLEPWLEALEEEGLIIDDYTGARDVSQPLPWEHLNAGMDKKFLLKERAKAEEGKITLDCRYESCSVCGVCDLKAKPSLLHSDKDIYPISNKLNFPERDQVPIQIPDTPFASPIPIVPKERASGKTKPPQIDAHLVQRAVRFRVWHRKAGRASYLSQLDIQPLLERALRRAGLPMSFSQGFHPLPLLTFGRALPVGVESEAEWFAITLRKAVTPQAFMQAVEPYMLQGMEIIRVELLPLTGTIQSSVQEIFKISFPDSFKDIVKTRLDEFLAQDKVIFEKENKQGDLKQKDIRAMVSGVIWQNNSPHFTLNFLEAYLSPATLIDAIFNGNQITEFDPQTKVGIRPEQLRIVKLAQFDSL